MRFCHWSSSLSSMTPPAISEAAGKSNWSIAPSRASANSRSESGSAAWQAAAKQAQTTMNRRQQRSEIDIGAGGDEGVSRDRMGWRITQIYVANWQRATALQTSVSSGRENRDA